MKYLISLFFLANLHLPLRSQDILNYKYQDSSINLLIQYDHIIFEKILVFDTSYKTEDIYRKIKPAISSLFIRPTVGTKFNYFEFQNINNQIIDENIENKSITAYLMFFTKKEKNGDPYIKEDIVVVSKCKFFLKDNKMKVIITDINLVWSSGTLSILVGPNNSLINVKVDDLIKKHKNFEIVGKAEVGKATYSALSILDKKLINFIKNEIDKSFKEEIF